MQLSLFESEMPTSFVYAGVRNGQIKIGTSMHPARRARELGITLLRVEAGGVETERWLHRRFRAAHIDREWFMPTADVLAWTSGQVA